jgi:hypothetical protein
MPLLLTNCTARKRGSSDPVVLSEDLCGDTLDITVHNWRRALATRHLHMPAVEVYAGRSVSEARRAAASAAGELFFLSAGLGVVGASENVPLYDLSPVQAEGGLNQALSKLQVSPSAWWSALSSNGLSQLIKRRRTETVLVALPSTYLKMLREDLLRCNRRDAERLRFFTSSAGVRELPDFLQPAAMPYDERLESIGGFGGTRADFPQRALRHFVEVLHGHVATQDMGRLLVSQALEGSLPRQVAARKRLDDVQLKRLMVSRWDACAGQSTKLLRALRDQEQVACEQGRFVQLWREVRGEISLGDNMRKAA